MRTNAIARQRNRRDRSQCKAAERRVLKAADAATAQLELVRAYAMLDYMASKGLFHKNLAARRKSQLARYVSSLQSSK